MNVLKNGTYIQNEFNLIFNHYVTKALETPVHACSSSPTHNLIFLNALKTDGQHIRIIDVVMVLSYYFTVYPTIYDELEHVWGTLE